MIALKLLIIYFSIAFLKFIWNTTLYFHCDFLMRKYIDNIYVDPFKNYNILNSVKWHFKRTDTYCRTLNTQDGITEKSQDILHATKDCFLHAMGVYYYRALNSVFWIFTDFLSTKKIIFIPVKLRSNIFFSFLCSLFDWFLLYLVGLFLDTSGIGQRILDSLHAFLSVLWQHL